MVLLPSFTDGTVLKIEFLFFQMRKKHSQMTQEDADNGSGRKSKNYRERVRAESPEGLRLRLENARIDMQELRAKNVEEESYVPSILPATSAVFCEATRYRKKL